MKALGTNPFALEQLHGLPEDAVRSILSGSKKLGTALNRAQAVCDALGLELYIGPPRDPGSTMTAEVGGDDFAAIPRYDAELSAGDGVANETDLPAGAIAFRRDWLSRANISPGHAMVVGVRGDSMFPTLADGDLVLIDRRRQSPRDRRIYALIGPDGEARVKRVERLPNALLLHSDNVDFPTELISAADANRVRILGEVAWWGHTVRD